jgi:hypothetical protein
MLDRSPIVGDDTAPVLFHGLKPEATDWPTIGEGLRTAHMALCELPVAQIVEAIDETCARWADREFSHRRRARADVVAGTGFSPETVDRSFDVELSNYRADTMTRLLHREFGDPQVLDSFRDSPELGGRALAIGPRVTTAVCSGNVPGLPALSIVRALLVKSAVILKVASGEPAFAAHFVRTLAEINPVLADAVFVTYWPGSDVAALRGAIEQADAVIAYGGDDACAAVRAQLLPHQRYVEHGHKVSVGIAMQDYIASVGLREVARRAANDVSMFNQHACISPQVYLVEQGTPSARDFAEALSDALAEYAAACPLGTVQTADAAALQMYRATMAWTAASAPDRGFWRPTGLDWAVTFVPELHSVPGTGNRVVSVVPITDTADIMRALRPLGRQLQNVGLGALGVEFQTLATDLGRLGASRVSEPGRMSSPSVIWRHDGVQCVSALVRWCDIEMHGEAAVPPRDQLQKYVNRQTRFNVE